MATLACLTAASPFAHAGITGPYTADANTPFLFHFDEAVGGSTTANSGVFSNGTNAGNGLTYGQNASIGTAAVAAPLITTVLGAAGTGVAGFGNAANINPGALTTPATNGVGVGFDFNNNGAFNVSGSTTVLPTDAVPLSNVFNASTKAFTLEAIIRTSAVSGDSTFTQEIICTDNSLGTAGSRGFQFRLNSSGNLEFNDVGGGNNPRTSTISVTDASLGANAWNPTDWFHVAVSYDGTNLSFYWTDLSAPNTAANLLGTVVALDPSLVDLSDSGNLIFGNDGRNGGNPARFSNEGLLGSIDEVRISTVARTADQFIFTAIPEPGVSALGTFGLTILLALRLRRKQST